MAERAPLKLRARDGEDMDVIAALLQDALVPMADMTYQKREKRFILVANRFNWHVGDEATPNPAPSEGDASFADEGEPAFERVNCGICFDRVRNVRFRDLQPQARDEILNLLTIKTEPTAITLIFSGGGAIQLAVEDIACHLEDIGQAWPTRWRPRHDESAEGAGGKDSGDGAAEA